MIYSLKELIEFSNKQKNQEKNNEHEIRVCVGSNCEALGSVELTKNLKKLNKNDKCQIKPVGCNGLCSEAIMLSSFNCLKNQETLYGKINLYFEQSSTNYLWLVREHEART